MGLFDKLFSKGSKTPNEMKEKSQEEKEAIEKESIQHFGHQMYIDNSDELVYLGNVKKVDKAKHRGGRICDVYIAKALICRDGDAIAPDWGDNVCFEVKENAIVDHELLDYVAAYYLNDISIDENFQNNDRYYLGEIVENTDLDNSTDKYTRGIQSSAVNQWFNRYMDKQEAIERKEIEEREQIKQEEEFRNRIKIDAEINERIERKRKEEEKERQDRINNPYLQLNNFPTLCTGIKSEDYDGINLSNTESRGDILRLRDVKKIGKDGAGTYLYTGYVGNTYNEDDGEFFNNHDKLPICFELYKRLEDIVQEQNPEEIEAVLKLLSVPQNYKDNSQLYYIGKLGRDTRINQYGEIERKTSIIRGENSDSPAIAKQIRSLQKNFKLSHNRDGGEGR